MHSLVKHDLTYVLPMTSKKILIIDDDPNIVDLMQNRLTANHYVCVTAHDGEQGLIVAEREQPDLIIVDVLMPKMDGYTFVRKLRKEAYGETVPVIVVTAKDKMKDLFELEGVQDYIVKPYRSEDLLERIRKRLGDN